MKNRERIMLGMIAIGVLALVVMLLNTGGGGSSGVSQEQRILESQGYTSVERNDSDLFNRCGEGVGLNFNAVAPHGGVVRVAVCHEVTRPGYWLMFY